MYLLIKAIITKEEKEEEKSDNSVVILPLHKRAEITDLED